MIIFKRYFFYLLNFAAICGFGLKNMVYAQQTCRAYANGQSYNTPVLSRITNAAAPINNTDTTDYSTISITVNAVSLTTAYQNLTFPAAGQGGSTLVLKVSGINAALSVLNQVTVQAYNNNTPVEPALSGSALAAMINNNGDSWISFKPQNTYNSVRVSISSTLSVGASINILYAYQTATPVSAFSVNQLIECLTGNSFTFTNNSSVTSGTLTYFWDFGDGFTSTATSPTHSYVNAGVYNVKLVATVNGCTTNASSTTIVTVIGGLFTGNLSGLPFYWVGSPGADWGNTANWRVASSNYFYVPPALPDASTPVFIGILPSVTCSEPVGQQITIGSSTIAQCANLSLGSNAVLKIQGSLTINGNLNDVSGATYGLQGSSTGNLIFSGSGGAVSLKFASGYQQLASLTINRTNTSPGAVTLTSPLAVFNAVNLGSNNILDSQNGNLTLKSTQNLTASVNTLPAGAVIQGTVNAERFFYAGGNPQGLAAYRSYRLLSSPVSNISYNYSGSQAASVYNLNYIKAGGFTTGAANGNFDKTGNPTFYLFREDVNADNTSFTSGNFRGIAKIDPSTNNIGTQSRFNLTNLADTTIQLAAGNGVLFFFRGDRTDFAGKTSLPFSLPQDVVFTNSGVLNQGNVQVNVWFNPTGKLSYTNSSAIKNDGVIGYNLVGNPYASTIDWNTNSAKNPGNPGIIFSNPADIDTKIYVFDPLAKTYNWFDSSIGTNGGSDGNPNVSNYIASGQGFFIRAKNSNASLTFTEAAKVNTQNSQTASMLLHLPNAAGNNLSSVKIELKHDEANYDYAAIYFNDNWQTGYNADEDAADLDGNGNNVNLSTFSADKKRLAINKMPALLNRQTKIPLYVKGNSGDYQLIFPEITNVPAPYQVFLKDYLTGDSVKAESGTMYSFQIDQAKPATYGDDRFALVFCLPDQSNYQLLSFKGSKVTAGFLLDWETKNEGNYTSFTIEKSTDMGKTFVDIGNIQSNFNGKYSFTDSNPVPGENIFRLKQNDFYNRNTYSASVQLMWQQTADQEKPFLIYPNPVIDLLTMALLKVQQGLLQCRIINMQGNLMISKEFSAAKLIQNVAKLSPGMYAIELRNMTTGAVIGTQKFIKR